jgi:hypothetical protein
LPAKSDSSGHCRDKAGRAAQKCRERRATETGR